MMVPFAMIAVLISFGLVGQAPKAPPKQSGEWVVIESKEGMFSFAMPVRPAEKKYDWSTALGQVRTTSYSCDNGEAYVVLRHDILPRPSPLDAVVAGFEEMLKENPGGALQVISRAPTSIQGVPGRELIAIPRVADRRGQDTHRILVLVRDANVYIAIARSGPGKPLPPEGTAFLNSLRFDGKPAIKPVLPKAMNVKAPATASPAPLTAKRKQVGKIDRVDTTSEGAFRTFLMAMAAGDEETLREITLPNPDLDWLLRDDGTPVLGIRELKQQVLKKRIERLREGDRVKLPGNQVHVIRPTEVGRDGAALRVEGMQSYAPMQRIKGRWKVDPAPLIAARKAAEAAKQAPR